MRECSAAILLKGSTGVADNPGYKHLDLDRIVSDKYVEQFRNSSRPSGN